MEAKDNYSARREMGQGKAQAISGGISEAVGSFAGFWAASSVFAIKASPSLIAPFPGQNSLWCWLGSFWNYRCDVRFKGLGMLNDSLFGLFGKNKKIRKIKKKKLRLKLMRMNHNLKL